MNLEKRRLLDTRNGTWESYVLPLKHGLLRFTWFPKAPVNGAPSIWRLPPVENYYHNGPLHFSTHPGFLANLTGTIISSRIDLMCAYHQIPVSADDIAKTAITIQFGLYKFCSMPFGLRNEAQTFQRFIDDVCCDLDFVFVYLDDILITSSSLTERLQHLGTLFGRLSNHGLVIHQQNVSLESPKGIS